MAKYEYETVMVEIADRVGRVTLNRPEKRNAMNPTLHLEMDDALARLEFDDDVGVVVVSGADGHFSAGMDLKEMFRELDAADPVWRKHVGDASIRWRWKRLSTYNKPTIAMVRGYCVGGAFTQLLGCDFALAAESAQFSLSEINWGILPGGLVSKLVSDTILPRHALYHACLGEAFSASEAERIGLINQAVPDDQLESAVDDLARRLLEKSPAALRATKHVMRTVGEMDVAQAEEYLGAKLLAMRVGDEEDSYNSGLAQFLDEKSYQPVHSSFRLKSKESDDQHGAADDR